MEVNPADVAGVRIWYKLGTAEFGIAQSALYHLLLLNPQRGCAILSGLREWERTRRGADMWAANNPYRAALGELGWEGCSDEDILMSSSGMNPPHPGQPPPRLPSKARPRRETQIPLPWPPPKPRKARSPPNRGANPSNQAATSRRRTRHSPVPMGRGGGSSPAAKAAQGAPLFGGG